MLRNERQDSDYVFEENGHLVYWDYVGKKYQLLEPTQPIDDPHVALAKVGQQNLLPTHVTLKPKDLEETVVTGTNGVLLGKPIPPGISAFLFFGSQGSKQDELNSISQSCIGREVTKKNRLYVTQVRDVLEAGWTPFYAPLMDINHPIGNPLHVLIVPNSIVAGGVISDAREAEKHSLVKAFIRWAA